MLPKLQSGGSATVLYPFWDFFVPSGTNLPERLLWDIIDTYLQVSKSKKTYIWRVSCCNFYRTDIKIYGPTEGMGEKGRLIKRFSVSKTESYRYMHGQICTYIQSQSQKTDKDAWDREREQEIGAWQLGYLPIGHIRGAHRYQAGVMQKRKKSLFLIICICRYKIKTRVMGKNDFE